MRLNQAICLLFLGSLGLCQDVELANNTTNVSTEIPSSPQNDTDVEMDIESVNALLTEPSSEKKDEEQSPDLSSSAIGGRSVLPRQYSVGCQAPTGETGVCGTVRQCPGIYRIRDASYLRSFLCGYQRQTPLVCCPTSWTTNYFYGFQQPTTRAPYFNYGYGDNRRPYYRDPYGQSAYPRYPQNQFDYSQPSFTQYPQYPRPVTSFHFSTTTTTTTRRPTRRTSRPTSQQTNANQETRPRKPSVLPNVCGTGTGLSRIVGGSEATPGSYPWMAAIYIQSGSSWLQACGGALVSNKHVITAAHCVVSGSRSQNLPSRLFLIRLGDHNLVATDELPDGVTKDVKVSKISRHSDFDSKTYKNDIAIMELDSPVEFSKYIQPLCLPYDGVYNSLDDEVAIVTGWGYTKYQGRGSDVLKQAAIRIWPQTECKESFKREVDITPEYLCAGDGTGKQDSCQGDSGGPLVFNEGTKFYLIGIVSFGKKCATPGYPGAYTRVTKYLDWINSHL